MNIVEKGIRRFDGFQQRHQIPSFIFGVVKKYGDDNAGNLAIQVTYAMFVSVFPLLLLLVTILSMVLANHPAERARLLHSALGQFPIVGQQLGNNIHALKRGTKFGFIFGIAGLFYGATGLAQAGLYSMAQVWNVPAAVRPNYVKRMARSFIFLGELAVALLITTTLAGFGTFGHHNFLFRLLGDFLAAAVNVLLYFAAFRTLTPRQVATRSLLPGVIVGGITWTVLQALGGYVVAHELRGASALYGFFGLVLGLVAWIYLGAQITIYAAEINTVLFHRLWPRGIVQPPLTDADQRSLALQVTQNQRRPEQEVIARFQGRPMTQDEYRDRDFELDNSAPGIERRSPSVAPSVSESSLRDEGPRDEESR